MKNIAVSNEIWRKIRLIRNKFRYKHINDVIKYIIEKEIDSEIYTFDLLTGRERKIKTIVEKYIGRSLINENGIYEMIHHLNNKKNDNRIENLYIFKTQSLHTKYHHQFKIFCDGLFNKPLNKQIIYLKKNSIPVLKSNLDDIKNENKKTDENNDIFDI